MTNKFNNDFIGISNQPERNPNNDGLMIDRLDQTAEASVSHKYLSRWKSLLSPITIVLISREIIAFKLGCPRRSC